MSTEDNRALARRINEELHNGHDLGAIDRYFSPALVDHTPTPGIPPNREGARMIFRAMFEAVPDLSVEIRDQAADGNKVWNYKTVSGTHKGTLFGVPATGNQFSFDVIDIYAFADGQLTEHWIVMDNLSLMQQLGAIPD
jgi:predicted ester cyclase